MDVQELRPGLWRWTGAHPEWDHAESWGPEVASVYAELDDAVVVVDPLVPADEEDRFWSALDRDVERAGRPAPCPADRALARAQRRRRARPLPRARSGARRRRASCPKGVHAEVVKGSDWIEALFFLEPHRALVAGDLLIGKDGGIEMPVEWFPKDEREWAESELKPDLRQPSRADFRSSSCSSRTASPCSRTARRWRALPDRPRAQP